MTKRCRGLIAHNGCVDGDVSRVAGLLAEPARARMVAALMDGRALPAGELAAAAGISAQTASNHLAKLLRARVLRMEAGGRHRYYSLAGTEVAAAFESLASLAANLPASERRAKCDEPTAFLRHCYSHMAGTIAVGMTDAMVKREWIELDAARRFRVTEAGARWLAQLGLNGGAARACIDWTERRPHLGGPLGVAMFHRFIELGWIAKRRESRALRILPAGAREMTKLFGMNIPARFVN